MPELKLGTYPPMCPRSIFLEQEMRDALVGRKITDTAWEKYHDGAYSWHGEAIEGLAALAGQRIIFADALYLLTDGGKLVFASYNEGGARYYEPGEPIAAPRAVKSVSHAYRATLTLEDGARMVFTQYGWGTLFLVFDVDIHAVNTAETSKRKRYPFLLEAPIDVTDPSDFTFERFADWMAQHPAVNVIECCATAKGAFRIDNPVMNYILLISGVHPRTKARALGQEDLRRIYDNTAQLIAQYQRGERICAYTDIRGRAVEAQNDILWLTRATLGKPCPVCGAPIEATPAAGTKMYYCRKCQT